MPDANEALLRLTSKKDKSEVNYMSAKKCLTCINYLHFQSGEGQCRLVKGAISPEAVCDLWTDRENSGPYDKNFFAETHRGTNGQ